ncbi:MAG: class I SAM-dependent methyltransferase [Alphaproteobacteria bacterium]|nr:class I SAM-dependent methyltransferase [Alphaproteobacteria bacterium]
MMTIFDKLTFETIQSARVGWFFGQKLLAARLSRPMPLPKQLRDRPMPDRNRILADLKALFDQDWRNIEAGYYALPRGEFGNPLTALRRSLDFFADLATVEATRHGTHKEVLLDTPLNSTYPRYYRQKFHFQTDGYLSEASAERYDHQVEVLFAGGAAAMRRQALVPLRQALAEHRAERLGRPPQLLDLACGTGVFLREVKGNWPRLHVTGLDLSPHYLAVAERTLAAWSRVRLVEGAGEAMPFGDGEFDIVTCIYLFHELPPRVRRRVVGEIRRVLRPGGTLILVDSLQTGDEPDYDGLLDSFPVLFHEPYYASYIQEDLNQLMSPDFSPLGHFSTYFSKVLSYRRKPDGGSGSEETAQAAKKRQIASR